MIGNFIEDHSYQAAHWKTFDTTPTNLTQDTGLTAPLSIGEMAAHDCLITAKRWSCANAYRLLNSESQKVTSAMLSGECKYMQEGNLWLASETQHLMPPFYRLWKQ